MITGINHLTFAVCDLERSLAFYAGMLGLRPVARWRTGAYLSAGETWIALIVDEQASGRPHPDYTHTAFTVPSQAFASLSNLLRLSGTPIWQENVSEGDSLYVLDPDGHRLEFHVSNLADHLQSFRDKPWEDLQVFDE